MPCCAVLCHVMPCHAVLCPTGGVAAADVTAWCEFHNGVAAGLKIAPRHKPRIHNQQHQQQQAAGTAAAAAAVSEGAAEGGGGGGGEAAGSRHEGSSVGCLSDSWLPHSKPAVANYAHAGVLLALGLNGHLDRLSWTDLYRWVCVGVGADTHR